MLILLTTAAEIGDHLKAVLLLIFALGYVFLQLYVQPYVDTSNCLLDHVEMNMLLTFVLSIIGALYVDVQTYP